MVLCLFEKLRLKLFALYDRLGCQETYEFACSKFLQSWGRFRLQGDPVSRREDGRWLERIIKRRPEFAARIHDLRAKGFNVITTIQNEVIFRGCVRKRVANYSLGTPEWIAHQVKEQSHE